MNDKQLEALAEEVLDEHIGQKGASKLDEYNWILAAMKEMYHSGSKEGWISVETLPVTGKDVLLKSEKYGIRIGHLLFIDITTPNLNISIFPNAKSIIYDVTHWRELPPSPNKTT